MKKIMLLMICMIMLTACDVKTSNGNEKKGSTRAEERYVAEKLLPEDVNFCARASWTQEKVLYALGSNRIDHEYQLLKYDMDCQELTKTVLEPKDNIISNVNQAYVNDKGELHALCYYLNAEETEIIGYRFCVFDSNGKLKTEKDYAETLRPYLKALRFPSSLIILPDDRLLFAVKDEKMRSTMVLLSDSGEIVFQKDLGKTEVRSLLLREDGKVFSLEREIKNDAPYTIGEIDLSTGNRKELAWKIPNAATIKFVEGMGEEAFFCVADDGIWEITVQEPRLVLSLEDLALSNAYDVSAACQLSDGTWRMLAIVKREEGEYNYFDYNVLRIDKAEGAVEQKTVLTLAVLSENVNYYKTEVSYFNKVRDDVKIVLKEYESIDSLITDFTAGIVPDLVDLAEGELYEVLKKKGLLEDLGNYLSNDKDVTKSNFCDKALEFYQENGNVYAIPYGMTILAMMGSKTYLGEREGWNLEEYKDFIDSLPNQMMATKGISKQEMLRILCIQYMTHFVDTSNGKCDFQTEEFRNLLEFVNHYPSQGANVNEIAAMFEEIQEGGIILIPAVLQEVHSYELYRALFSDGAQMIGYPTENKKGITLVPVGKTLAMISTGDHKSVAWDFVKYSMVNKTIGFEVFYSFRPFYNELIAEARDNADSDEMAMHIPLGSINLEVPHASLSEIDMLERMILNGNVTRIGDEAVIKIISEEAEAFFNGSKNIEQVTEIIQNRVKLFVAE